MLTELYGLLIETDEDLDPPRDVYFHEEVDAAGSPVVTLLVEAGLVPDGWHARPVVAGDVLVDVAMVDGQEGRFVVAATELDGLEPGHVVGVFVPRDLMGACPAST